MADAEAVNAVAAGSIEAINGVAKASVQAINDAGLPAAGATLWCLVGADGAVATAAASDLNAWTGYVSADMGAGEGLEDYNSIAYGKDGSGNGLWVAVNDDDDRQIRYTSDPTAGIDAWSDVDGTDDDMLGVAWGNNVWIAVGEDGELWRSTAGTTGWSEVDLSGVTGWVDGDPIWEVVSDGAGKWMFGQGTSVFLSTNDGAAWSRVVDFSSWSGTDIASDHTVFSMAYTASRWSVYLSKSGSTRAYHAAAADTAAWTIAQDSGGVVTGTDLINGGGRRMAAGDGTVIIVDDNDTSRSTDGGQTWTKNSGDLPRVGARDIATDGQGNWVVVQDSGRVAISTNDGDSWAEQSGNNASTGSRTRLSFPFNGTNIEGLDAIAANVFLPL